MMLLVHFHQMKRKKIRDAAKELSKWLADNPNSTQEQNEEKLKDFEKEIDDIIKRAEAKHNLTNLADVIKSSDDKLTKQEKNKAIDKTNDALDWLQTKDENKDEQLNDLKNLSRFLNDNDKNIIEKETKKFRKILRR